jgi:hypothetical protein
MADNIPLLPDTAATYLKFYCMEKIFSTDGEARDPQRAKYCGARWIECCNLFKSISGEEMLEKPFASK